MQCQSSSSRRTDQLAIVFPGVRTFKMTIFFDGIRKNVAERLSWTPFPKSFAASTTNATNCLNRARFPREPGQNRLILTGGQYATVA